MFKNKSLKKEYKFYITLFLVCLFLLTAFVSIGYSALNKDIQVSGEINYEKYEVWAENVSYDNSITHLNCTDTQCVVDCIADESLCP